ncbi:MULTISPECIES: DUF5615 family PIN-like protein [Spirulina sp. CCY15215]|uniref:DUF5615 family PIN-like protein n=1 Tax=Spirulina sp. CCY15215 TaxID=2767591 RepID=UPI00194DE074|nr:DUF5615 family PIN-like protein [Spirulina major]
MSQFYSDENLPIDLVQELRELGYDILTFYEAKSTSIPAKNFYCARISTVVIKT